MTGTGSAPCPFGDRRGGASAAVGAPVIPLAQPGLRR